MIKIKAKPVSDKFWILRQNDKKIGQVIHTPQGYTVILHGNSLDTYPSFKVLKENTKFEFSELPGINTPITDNAHGYPTEDKAYNAIWNLRYKLPLYTKAKSSKSWYCAGYYKVIINKQETIEFCPKLITLQRNRYRGPFKRKPKLLFDKLMETVK